MNIRWIDILGKDEITITESKTGKVRSITVNESLKEVLKYSSTKYSLTGRFKIENYLFANRKDQKFTIQYANRLLKSALKTYGIKIQNASTHTLRKTFGKRVWEMDGQSERSLVYLSQIFNHSNVGITRSEIKPCFSEFAGLSWFSLSFTYDFQGVKFVTDFHITWRKTWRICFF